jgi:hypothetical protein
MSIIFVPKIKDSYANVPARSVLAKKPKTNYNSISERDLKRIVCLRAMNVSYNNIAKLIHRSANTCAWHVHDKMLFIEINQLQQKLINDIMEEDE